MQLSTFAKRVQSDTMLANAVRADPVAAMTAATAEEIQNIPNTLTYWIVVLLVGTMGLASVAGIIALAVLGKSTPESLVSLASVMGGGLVGVLVPTQRPA